MMSQKNPGILAIWNDCEPGSEDAFEEWYQHEHLLERIAVPGFLIGRRYEAVSSSPRYFCCYVTESPEVLTAPPYLERLANPTVMTRRMMSDTFHKTIRTICRRTLRLGAMRGAAAVAVRFDAAIDPGELAAFAETLVRDRAVACVEVWSAADASAVAISEEEKLRGGDGKITACLLVETLREADAETLAVTLKRRYPLGVVGIYRLLCEIRKE